LTGPVSDNATERFHMYFFNQNPIEGVNLDVDDVTSFGPETTTISEVYEGTYRYSVFNFSAQNSSGALEIEQSPAKVEVFDSSGLIQRFNPPAAEENSGNTWRVFEIDVNNSGSFNVQPLQAYDLVNDSDDGRQFKTRGDKAGISFNTSDF